MGEELLVGLASTKGRTAPPLGHPVALYFHRLGNTGGGAERMICLLANALCKRGFAVHMITWDDPDVPGLYALDPRIVWSRLGFRPGVTDKLRRTGALVRLLRDRQIRILVGFVMSGDKTVYTAAKLAKVRLIVAERNAPTMYHLKYGFAQRWLCFGLLHLADRITVQMADFVEGYPTSLRNRIEVIPNPVPVAERRAKPDQAGADGRFNLLAVGRLDGVQKRYERLVGAFARIVGDQPAWDLLIVGDGPKRDSPPACRAGWRGRAGAVEVLDIRCFRRVCQLPPLCHTVAMGGLSQRSSRGHEPWPASHRFSGRRWRRPADCRWGDGLAGRWAGR